MKRCFNALSILCVAAILSALALPTSASSQVTTPEIAPADSAMRAALHQAVLHQWTLRLVTTSGDSITARAVSLTDTTLGVVSRKIPLSTLQRIDHRTSTSGFLAGALIGIVPGALIGASFAGFDRQPTESQKIRGAIGGAIIFGGFGGFLEAMFGRSGYKWDILWPAPRSGR